MRGIVVVIFILTTTCSFAADPPHSDVLGVYFDLHGWSNCLTPAPMTPFVAYLILTDPSESEVHAYEFRYRFSASDHIILATEVAGADPTLPQPDYDPKEDQFVVAPNTAIPTTQATVLVTWTMMLLSYYGGDIYLGPSEVADGGTGVMAYLSATGWITLTPSSGHPSEWVASFYCPDPVQMSTFGTMKALYR